MHNAAVQLQSLHSVFIRFNELLCKAGSEHNRSRFIVKRSFCEEFTATKRDPSKTQFVGRRNDFYFQFQQLANNYSQVVKIVNPHFSNVAIPHWNSARGSWKPLSIEIQNLAKRAVERLRIQGQVPRMEGRYVTTRKKVDKDEAEVLFRQKMLGTVQQTRTIGCRRFNRRAFISVGEKYKKYSSDLAGFTCRLSLNKTFKLFTDP